MGDNIAMGGTQRVHGGDDWVELRRMLRGLRPPGGGGAHGDEAVLDAAARGFPLGRGGVDALPSQGQRSQGPASLLKGISVEEIATLASEVEAALGHIREAHMQVGGRRSYAVNSVKIL